MESNTPGTSNKYTIMAMLLAVALSYIHSREKAFEKSAQADKIFISGNIITIDSVNSMAQAVAISDGKIIAVGTNEEIAKLKGDQTEVIDLQGKTLVPGFIDGHSHFMALGRSRIVNIASPPVGIVNNISDIVTSIQKFIQNNKIPKGTWIHASGYDPDLLAEKRHPEKEDLDKAFPDYPVVLGHVSGHMSVANSLALKLSGIQENTPDPKGGVIVRKTNTQEPTGLLLEYAARLLKSQDNTPPSLEEQLKLIEEQQTLYASHGITTAQDGSTGLEAVKLLQIAAERGKLYLDIESLPGYRILDSLLINKNFKFGTLHKHLKFAGFKFFTDGSPQGKTAFFTKPYQTEVPGCDHHCTGIPTVSQDELNQSIVKGFKNNIQTYVHCNGDAAIDMYIEAIRYANTQLGDPNTDRRPVVIHSQFVRPDQLDSYKELGMIPAFFSNHAFFWGDVHTRNLGESRAFFLSPHKTALKKKIIATNHTDFPVTPINQLFLLWTSVARESRSKAVVGANEKLSPLEGLRTITIHGAYQYFEENLKGSIEKGKLADFAILSHNPLSIETNKIKDILVLETIKEGKTIFKKK